MPNNLTSISFPASPSVGSTYTYGNQTYQWNGTEWVVSYDSNSIPIGAVTLSGNQTITGVKTFSDNMVASSDLTLVGNLTVDTNTLFVNSASNMVGIGTLSPATKLDVNGDIRLSAVNATIELNNGGAKIYSTSANTLQFAVSGTINSPVERMRISSTGNVGIGTNNPTQKLDVNGNINITGNATITGNTTITGSVETTKTYLNNEYDWLKFSEGNLNYQDCNFGVYYLSKNKKLIFAGMTADYGTMGTGNIQSLRGMFRKAGLPVLQSNETIDKFYSTKHCCFILTTLGNLYSIGDNRYGQLGIGNTTNSDNWVKPLIPAGNKVIYFATHTGNVTWKIHSFAICEDTSNPSIKRVYSWGSNTCGQLGIGNTTQTPTPTLVNIGAGITPSRIYVAGDEDGDDAHNGISFLVDTDNKVYACGKNSSHGGMGISTLNTNITTFQVCNKVGGGQLLADTDIQVGSLSNVTCTFAQHGNEIWFCGNNEYGQAGIGTVNSNTNNDYNTGFKKIPNLSVKSFVSASMRRQSLAAITTDDKLVTWGYNANHGALGNNTTNNKSTPSAPVNSVAGTNWPGNENADWTVKTVKKIFMTGARYSANGYYTNTNLFVIDSDDILWASGVNYHGNCGHAPIADAVSRLVRVNTTEKFKEIRAFGTPRENNITAYIGVTTNNQLYAWGYNWTSNALLPISNYLDVYCAMPIECLTPGR